jgi:uncharacterized membrane protein
MIAIAAILIVVVLLMWIIINVVEVGVKVKRYEEYLNSLDKHIN